MWNVYRVRKKWYLPRAAAATSRAVLAAEVVASRKLDDRVVVSSEILQY
jgi:hypothetical protein